MMTDGNANQQQLLSDSSVHITDVTITEETPLTDLTDQQPEEERIPSAIPETFDWNTSMVSQVRTLYTI